MTNFKHTPGPWHYWTSGVNDSGAPKYAVACVGSGKDITYNIHNLGDARLIAAAPELLEAGHEAILAIITLKNFLLDIADIEGISGERRKEVYRQIDAADGLLDAAITKAEGKL